LSFDSRQYRIAARFDEHQDFYSKNIKKSHMKHLLIFFFLSLSLNTFAQDRVIKGRVTDDTGVPLQGVSVIPKALKPVYKLIRTETFQYQYLVQEV
jgi:hypothetical protein